MTRSSCRTTHRSRPAAGGARGASRDACRCSSSWSSSAALIFAGDQVFGLDRRSRTGSPTRRTTRDRGRARSSFVVDPGQTVESMGDKLEDIGVVASSEAFVEAAEDDAGATGIQAGTYLLKEEMKASDVVAVLVDPGNLAQSSVTIPEGLRVVDVIDLLAEGTDFSKKQLTAGAERHRGAGTARLRGREPGGLPVPGHLRGHPRRHPGVGPSRHGRALGAGGRATSISRPAPTSWATSRTR